MNMRVSAERASFENFAFSHSKTAISFNILLVLLILYLRNIFQVSNYNLHQWGNEPKHLGGGTIFARERSDRAGGGCGSGRELFHFST